MRQGSEIFFWPPQFFQIFADFSPSNCSSSKTVPSFSFSFFFPKSQDPYVLPGQKIVKKTYFWIFIFFDKFSGLYLNYQRHRHKHKDNWHFIAITFPELGTLSGQEQAYCLLILLQYTFTVYFLSNLEIF